MVKAIINGRIFNGDSLLSDHAVVMNGNNIHDVIPQSQLPDDIDIDIDLQGDFLVPGFIDLQVNGGGGVLFNDAPNVNSIRIIGEAHSNYGTTGFLPTLITDSFDVMRRAIIAVNDAIEQGVPGVLGIHLEGPFLNDKRKGVHDAEKFRQIDEQGLEIISSLKLGKTLVTIAPELTTVSMIEQISDKGVIVCAGHSEANYKQTRKALDAGLSGFTHLYNAMTPLTSREPGIVGAALVDEKSWFGIIADGYHVHPAAFKVAVKAKQRGGAILVTDAMPTVGAIDKKFEINGETIHAINGRCANKAGTLAGSDLDMISAINNTVKFTRMEIFEAIRMASLYPARALGLDHILGYIKPGYVANFNALNDDNEVIHTWINGKIRKNNV
jgi:N-acetylglucosamine-6-phosphate deacetylase